jgi:predicted metal-binding membrane protein
MATSEQIVALPPLPICDRVIIVAELAALTALAWLYLVRMPMSAADFGAVAARLAAPVPSEVVDLWLTFMMWAVMMVAMMLPSAAPMIMTYARIASDREGAPASRAWIFAAGYVVIWTAFSVAATAAQSALQHATIISNALSVAPIVGAVILIGAGIYQLTPLKLACLGHCQSPVGFFMTHWRSGAVGAFRMGLSHGEFCVGCCWMLMALLFVAGVMNLAWVAALSALVLLEKLTPWPRTVARSTGAVLVIWGLLLALRS